MKSWDKKLKSNPEFSDEEKVNILKIRKKITDNAYDLNAMFERGKQQAYKAVKEKYKIN